MRLYTKQHQHSCGIDLHTNKMYLCILNQEGDILLHRNIKTEPATFLAAIAPYREDLVVCAEESNDKKYGAAGKKIGNAHLRWAFSLAAQLFLKSNEPGRQFHDKLVRKHGKGKALSILAHKLGRAVYFMLKNRQGFSMQKFLTA